MNNYLCVYKVPAWESCCLERKRNGNGSALLRPVSLKGWGNLGLAQPLQQIHTHACMWCTPDTWEVQCSNLTCRLSSCIRVLACALRTHLWSSPVSSTILSTVCTFLHEAYNAHEESQITDNSHHAIVSSLNFFSRPAPEHFSHTTWPLPLQVEQLYARLHRY